MGYDDVVGELLSYDRVASNVILILYGVAVVPLDETLSKEFDHLSHFGHRYLLAFATI